MHDHAFPAFVVREGVLPASVQENGDLTITDPTTLNRRVATSMPDVPLPPTQLTDRLVSHSMAWTQSQVLANYLSLGWQSGLSDDPYIVGTQLRDKNRYIKSMI